MNQTADDELLRRVLLVAPTKRDEEITSLLLRQAGLPPFVCSDLAQLVEEVTRGAGAIVLTEEVLGDHQIEPLIRVLQEQPEWSDLPIVLLLRGGVGSSLTLTAFAALNNIIFLDRPVATRSLVSAVQAAVRGRERQYLMRDQLEAIRRAEAERQVLLTRERVARAEAERASQMKDEFLATLSHELRTPLNAISGWTQLLKISHRDAATVLEGVNVIDRNVRVQTQLIEDLLDMSRIISGKVRLEVQEVDVQELVAAAIESIGPAFQAKDVTLEQNVSPTVGKVRGDPARLQQVLWNLLSNAVKFTPKQGKVFIAAARIGLHVEISVRDTGEGISPKFLPQLFERFSQADGSTTRRHGGLGIGLSIVRNLVEIHGGTVQASSQGIGQGATFTIQLPSRDLKPTAGEASPSERANSRETAASPVVNLRGLRVLVVEDDDDAREYLRRFLQGKSVVAQVASSATEARPLLASFRPDLIISDIGMPDQDGYSFMREVRAAGLQMPAIALTAFARAEDSCRAIDAGFQDHLPKPVEPKNLIAAVARLTGRLQ